jgi:hypothetical protein
MEERKGGADPPRLSSSQFLRVVSPYKDPIFACRVHRLLCDYF